MQITPFLQKITCTLTSTEEKKENENPISLVLLHSLPSQHSAGLKQELKPYFFKIKNVFTDQERETILLICNRCLGPIKWLSGKCYDMLSSTDPERLCFSSSHSLMEIPRGLFYRYNFLYSIESIYKQTLNHFANALKLVGNHNITFKIIRGKIKDGNVFDFGWHYDKNASKSMVILLKNNIEYLPGGKGLDIALNSAEGPHNPRESGVCFPKDGKHISVKYNDAIMLDNAKGSVIHRMSPLNPEASSDNPERIIIQLKLGDPNWH